MTAPTVLVHGPAASGKSFYATQIADHFGCNTIVEDFDPYSDNLIPGALHLSRDSYDYGDEVIVTQIDDVMREIRG